LPAGASFALTTGCQMAHVTCFAAARHSLLVNRGWDVEKKGLASAPEICVVANDQRHGSIERAVRLLGLGVQSIINVETDSRGCIPPAALDDTLRRYASNAPTIVLLHAGEFHTGAFDEFSTLIPIARRYGAWVHVDGAFGLWAAASPKFCHLTKG